jgi:tRNA A37 threonylcarbamoyladenosine synthetase subunit TsaC/SUA5/YrdC
VNCSDVHLVQTDTTVGFLSSDDKKLTKLKNRTTSKKILQVVSSFEILKSYTRVPKKFRKLVRRAKKTTFIFPNKLGFRVVPKNSHHYNFVNKYKILYSTSANQTNKSFDNIFALKSCDISIHTKDNYNENTSLDIYMISKNKINKIR